MAANWFGVVTLFPEMFKAVTECGVTGRAVRNGLVSLKCWSPRDYAHDKYATVDGRTFGGGPGMLMMVGPLREAIAEARKSAGGRAKVLYMSPRGRRLDQEGVIELSREQRLILVCGRYEGIDQRVIDSEIDEEWSVGDYVLSGGELPAMIMIDAVSRMIPGVLGDEDSAEEDSFMHGLLDFPQYTRPESIDGMDVPEVLRGGNHSEIRKWRMEEAVGRTFEKRPDLIRNLALTDDQMECLARYLRRKSQSEGKS